MSKILTTNLVILFDVFVGSQWVCIIISAFVQLSRHHHSKLSSWSPANYHTIATIYQCRSIVYQIPQLIMSYCRHLNTPVTPQTKHFIIFLYNGYEWRVNLSGFLQKTHNASEKLSQIWQFGLTLLEIVLFFNYLSKMVTVDKHWPK